LSNKSDQLKRFKEKAKELECDESSDALDKAFKELRKEAKPKPKAKQGK
jgi:hypothetical protein